VFAYCNAATLDVPVPRKKHNGEFVMNRSSKILAAGLMAAAAPWLVAPAAAAPMSSPLGLQNAVAPSVETVQYRRGWRGGRSGGVGVGLGVAAGAIVGGAIIGATQPYGYRGHGGYEPGYAYEPGYSYAPGYAYQPGYVHEPGYAYAPGYAQSPSLRRSPAPGYAYAPGYDQGYVAVSPYAGGGDVASCRQRFRSYNPASGTYLGFDGLRHPCP
jgi:BA14K-like protein